MNKKVSLIIPVFNAEEYISRCVDSALQQSYKNIEILLINDGSTDNSSKIIKKYSTYENVIIINKNNSGVSEARNVGLKKCSGDYVLFLDSDDFIDNDYIENLIKVVTKNKCDLVVTGFKEVSGENVKYKSIYQNLIKLNETLDITFPNNIKDYLATIEFNPCWKMLVSSSLIKNNNLKFNKNIKYGEDMLFSFQCYVLSKKTVYYLNYGYNYYINLSSAMNKKSINALKKYYDDNLETYNLIIKQINFNKLYLELFSYKTLQVFKGITGKLIESSPNYKIYKYNYIRIRNNYNSVFNNFSLKKEYGVEGLLIFMLKLRLNYLYYILRRVKR